MKHPAPAANNAAAAGVGGIPWKWLAGILTVVLISAGAAWIGTVSTDTRDVRSELGKIKAEGSERAADIREIKRDVEAIKESTKQQQKQQDKIVDNLDKLKDLIQEDRMTRERRRVQ